MAERIENDLANVASDESRYGNASENLSERRVPRSIRFSDSEWKLIEGVARERGMAAAELVRHVSVGFAMGKITTEPSENTQSLLPMMADQIERIYNGVYMLASLKREEMLDNGQNEELEKIIEDARKSKKLFQEDPSSRNYFRTSTVS